MNTPTPTAREFYLGHRAIVQRENTTVALDRYPSGGDYRLTITDSTGLRVRVQSRTLAPIKSLYKHLARELYIWPGSGMLAASAVAGAITRGLWYEA